MSLKVAQSYISKVGRLLDANHWYQKEGYGTKINGGASTNDYGTVGLYKDITVSSAEILALNATPKSLIAAPGAGLITVFKYAHFFLDYNAAAYAAIDALDNWELRYTNGSGQLIATIETIGFLDQTADQNRVVYPATTAAITPVANAAVVLYGANGEVTTGDSPMYIRMFYDIIPSTLS